MYHSFLFTCLMFHIIRFLRNFSLKLWCPKQNENFQVDLISVVNFPLFWTLNFTFIYTI